jgi:hypothetical protein
LRNLWDLMAFHELLSVLVSLRWNLELCDGAHKHDRDGWQIEAEAIALYYTPTDPVDQDGNHLLNSTSELVQSSANLCIGELADENLKIGNGQNSAQFQQPVSHLPC